MAGFAVSSYRRKKSDFLGNVRNLTKVKTDQYDQWKKFKPRKLTHNLIIEYILDIIKKIICKVFSVIAGVHTI